jgi:gamma-tubulin complex component 2
MDEFAFRIPGVEGFSFSYEVKWPISLVLHPRVIICYQMIFRHLFFCKHVERQLCKVWIAKKAFKDSNLSNDLEKAAAFSLRQKMLNFVQNLQYYMAFEVSL